MIVTAIDAGVSTGVFIIEVDTVSGDTKIRGFGQFERYHPVDTVDRLVKTFEKFDPDVVVVERFDLRPRNNFIPDLTTLKVNSMLEYYLSSIDIRRRRLVFQTPAQAKTLVTNQALKQLGFFPTGRSIGKPDADDVRDAARHAYRFLIMEEKMESLAAKLTE